MHVTCEAAVHATCEALVNLRDYEADYEADEAAINFVNLVK